MKKLHLGTRGKFEIFLETNEKIRYQINFKSKNEKPKNLRFQIEGKDRKYEKLEDMEQELKGEISNHKSIVIDWEWEYSKNLEDDRQDTEDGKNIKQFQFSIYAIGQLHE